jgi:hypothetical protein
MRLPPSAAPFTWGHERMNAWNTWNTVLETEIPLC